MTPDEARPHENGLVSQPDGAKSAAVAHAGPPDWALEVNAPDPVEEALAEALRGATAAGQWSVVAQLARELEARRAARAHVIKLDVERERRGAK